MRHLTSFRRAVHVATPALALGTAVVTAALAACSDTPTGPATPNAAEAAFHPGLHANVSSSPMAVTPVKRTQRVAQDSVVTFTVQPGGTTFRGPDASISFPAGFVTKPTQFTATRKGGSALAYDFQPSGTFTKPVTVTFTLAGAAIPAGANLSALQGAYVQDWSQVSDSTAAVSELEPTTVDPKSGTVTMTLSHFSGYLVSWGRR